MKKSCIIFILLFIIILTTGITARREENCEYFRIHISAHSQSAEDISLKYKVRDAVTDYLTPIIADCGDRASAIREISLRLDRIETVADGVLARSGADYKSEVAIKRENFPSRVYEQVTLPAGEYDSLIITLGEGNGDNWWCVIYPPLCFGGNVIYKSKIAEIIEEFFK